MLNLIREIYYSLDEVDRLPILLITMVFLLLFGFVTSSVAMIIVAGILTNG